MTTRTAPWLCVLRLALSAGTPAAAFTQAATSARQAKPSPTKELTVTQLAEAPRAAADDKAIRAFRISVPEAALVDLRRRIAATRWPEHETVADQSQGVKLNKLHPLVRYWGTDYSWRKAEARLNAIPQFVTTIDGVDIQFAHIKS